MSESEKNGTPILSVKNLCHVYGKDTPFEKAALNDITCDIYQNEFIGIIGHTGSGKSTFVKHLNALMKPSSGNVFYNGSDIWDKGFDRRKLRFNVGMVFQYPEYQLFEDTVEKDVRFGPVNMGLTDAEIDERVKASLEFVGLSSEVSQRSPFELSGGQKRRAAIAGIFAMRPEVLILDEPTAGLDPQGRDDILEGIDRYHRTEKASVILVSHRMEDIARYADRVFVMNLGAMAFTGSTTEVFGRTDELRTLGLDVPQVARILNKVSRYGYTFSSGVFDINAAAAEIVKMSERTGKL